MKGVEEGKLGGRGVRHHSQRSALMTHRMMRTKRLTRDETEQMRHVRMAGGLGEGQMTEPLGGSEVARLVAGESAFKRGLIHGYVRSSA